MFGVIARQPGFHRIVQDMPIVQQIGGLYAIIATEWEKNYEQNGKKLELLRNLRLVEKKFSNEERDRASSIWTTLNKGGLCYPIDQLRDFAFTILDIIAVNMNVETFGNEAISRVHKVLQKSISALKQKWDSAITTVEQNSGIMFDKDISGSVMNAIILKVLHARVNVFVKAYREKTTSRFARSKAGGIAADVNFRTGLKIQTKRNISSSNSSDIASVDTTNTETHKKNKK
jgi:hypothetical protein